MEIYLISKMISNVVKVPRSVFRIIFIFVSLRGLVGRLSVKMSGAVELVICLSANILHSPGYLGDDLFANFLVSLIKM